MIKILNVIKSDKKLFGRQPNLNRNGKTPNRQSCGIVVGVFVLARLIAKDWLCGRETKIYCDKRKTRKRKCVSFVNLQ